MKWQRCSTFTPGHAVSTMNAVICRFSFPFTTLDGVRAITTSNSALVPLVHHSFSPFRIHAWPSGVGTAVVSIAAGSEPTPGSVRAKAEIARSEERRVGKEGGPGRARRQQEEEEGGRRPCGQ